jgi:hypothetical protein
MTCVLLRKANLDIDTHRERRKYEGIWGDVPCEDMETSSHSLQKEPALLIL